MTDVKRATLSVRETAARLGISKNVAYEAVRRGEIPSIRLGGRILIPKVALDRLLETGAKSASSGPGPLWSGGG